MKKLVLFIISFLTIMLNCNAQSSQNYYKTRDAFWEKWNKYSKEEKEQNKKELKNFNKWDFYWQSRVDNPDMKGDFKQYYKQLERLTASSGVGNPQLPDEPDLPYWTNIGPTTSMQSGPFYTGIITAVDFHPNYNGQYTLGTTPNPDNGENTIYAGSPTGGLWSSKNGGGNWNNMGTDQLFTIGAADMEISRLNGTNFNIYMAGSFLDLDGDYGGNPIHFSRHYASVIYKKSNTGLGWQQCGTPFNAASYISGSGTLKKIYDIKLRQNPTSDRLFCASSLGLHYSDNQGSSWNQATLPAIFNTTMPEGPIQVEFRRTGTTNYYLGCGWGDYGSGNALIDLDKMYRSTNGGTTFSQWQTINKQISSNGLYLLDGSYSTPINENRFFISGHRVYTSESNGSRLYILVYIYPKSPADRTALVGNPRMNFGSRPETVAIFVSNNQGTNWNFVKSFPNKPGSLGLHSFAVDAGDENISYIGFGNEPMQKMIFNPINNAVNVSNINGYNLNNWSIGANNYHSDQRVIRTKRINNTITNVLVGTDGGVNLSKDRMNTIVNANGTGLNVTQLYELGISQTNEKYIIGGTQDNSLFKRDPTTANWSQVEGGDGYSSTIHPTNDNYWLYKANSILYLKTNSPITSTMLPSNDLHMNAAYAYQIGVPNNLFIGNKEIQKNTNYGQGGTWSNLGSYGSPTDKSIITNLSVHPFNANVMAYTTYWPVGGACGIYYTINNGANWNLLADADGSTSCWHKSDLLLVPNGGNNRLYATFGGYNANKKVGYYDNFSGNINWINNGLPNFPVYCITRDDLTGYLYVGTDVGVYYLNPNASGTLQWKKLGLGLPNIIVTSIKVHNSTHKVRASTYGRGIWEVDASNL